MVQSLETSDIAFEMMDIGRDIGVEVGESAAASKTSPGMKRLVNWERRVKKKKVQLTLVHSHFGI